MGSHKLGMVKANWRKKSDNVWVWKQLSDKSKDPRGEENKQTRKWIWWKSGKEKKGEEMGRKTESSRRGEGEGDNISQKEGGDGSMGAAWGVALIKRAV